VNDETYNFFSDMAANQNRPRIRGIGLREIARNMGIPEGTVLARAKREGWTRDIRSLRGRTS
jgi:hypothetical protein